METKGRFLIFNVNLHVEWLIQKENGGRLGLKLTVFVCIFGAHVHLKFRGGHVERARLNNADLVVVQFAKRRDR
jgi:hypothetical protein